ncbi:hypothetical protein E1301_Tti005208 [Triplophysa tibetana]|uniref:Uncharacterized protein n=1 Tax=Triplophysa tibetana TaxID=1572043 RepID=A0A5A9PPY8_9TELE|nr:hypothetical protein E1301_Tti005208 [Triplophysa tibetana]
MACEFGSLGNSSDLINPIISEQSINAQLIQMKVRVFTIAEIWLANMTVTQDYEAPMCREMPQCLHLANGRGRSRQILLSGPMGWKDAACTNTGAGLERTEQLWKASGASPTPCHLEQTTPRRQQHQFVREGQKITSHLSIRLEAGHLSMARDWKILADIGQKLIFPPEIGSTNLRPDMVLFTYP